VLSTARNAAAVAGVGLLREAISRCLMRPRSFLEISSPGGPGLGSSDGDATSKTSSQPEGTPCAGDARQKAARRNRTVDARSRLLPLDVARLGQRGFVTVKYEMVPRRFRSRLRGATLSRSKTDFPCRSCTHRRGNAPSAPALGSCAGCGCDLAPCAPGSCFRGASAGAGVPEIRILSTLAPLRALRARTFDRAR
jgi:hypothetical protein